MIFRVVSCDFQGVIIKFNAFYAKHPLSHPCIWQGVFAILIWWCHFLTAPPISWLKGRLVAEEVGAAWGAARKFPNVKKWGKKHQATKQWINIISNTFTWGA